MSDIVRLREEMLRMAMGAKRDRMPDWFIAEGYARMKRATAAKVAPKRPRRTPREVMQNDERTLLALKQFYPAKSNVEIGNHLGVDGGRVSECMKAALTHGGFGDGLTHLRELVRPAYERGDKQLYLRWQRAKKT